MTFVVASGSFVGVKEVSDIGVYPHKMHRSEDTKASFPLCSVSQPTIVMFISGCPLIGQILVWCSP